jgi:hypothetical protein
MPVEFAEQAVDRVEVGTQAGVEVPQIAFANLRLQLVENLV